MQQFADSTAVCSREMIMSHIIQHSAHVVPGRQPNTIFHVCLNAAKMDQTRKHIFHWFSLFSRSKFPRLGLGFLYTLCEMNFLWFASMKRAGRFTTSKRFTNWIAKTLKWNKTNEIFLSFTFPSRAFFPFGSFRSFSYHFRANKRRQIRDLFRKVCYDMESV